jgi:predicted cobalt transporter CbtA
MELTLGAVVRRGLIAGAVAGVAASLFALIAVEPSIRRALAVEEARPSDGEEHEELVGRTMQVIGGVVAAVAVALCVGLVVAVVFAKLRHHLPGTTDFGRAGTLAACGFVAIALVPAIKYPANPPGVGDPETINTRTLQYATLIAASIAVIWLAFLVRATVAKRGWQPPPAAVAAVAVAVVGFILLVLIWPDTPDSVPGDISAKLLWEFRIASIGELAALWATLGLALGLLLTSPRTADTALGSRLASGR